MKIYEKPDVEYVALTAKEEIANGGMNGQIGVSSNNLFPLG